MLPLRKRAVAASSRSRFIQRDAVVADPRNAKDLRSTEAAASMIAPARVLLARLFIDDCWRSVGLGLNEVD